jgi:hypothetical protein
VTAVTWEAALDKWLAPWRKRPEVTGALVCGSYVTGNPSPRSDIDVHIILKPSTKWRERGNDIVDQFLIEYFSNPPGQIRNYFSEDYADNRHMCATQFATGRVVFDSSGAVRKLKAEARRWIERPFKRPGVAETAAAKYELWDQLDNFHDACERGSPELTYLYANDLQWLLRTYARHRGDSVPSAAKTYRFLTPSDFASRYLQRPFSDAIFARRFAVAMLETDPAKMLTTLESLTRYVHRKMGGFEIDGFRLRSPATKG